MEECPKGEEGNKNFEEHARPPGWIFGFFSCSCPPAGRTFSMVRQWSKASLCVILWKQQDCHLASQWDSNTLFSKMLLFKMRFFHTVPLGLLLLQTSVIRPVLLFQAGHENGKTGRHNPAASQDYWILWDNPVNLLPQEATQSLPCSWPTDSSFIFMWENF